MATVMQMHPFSICPLNLKRSYFHTPNKFHIIPKLFSLKKGTVLLLWDIVVQCSLCEKQQVYFAGKAYFLLAVGTCYAHEICAVLCYSLCNDR
jgi:hypothetical protein